MAGLGGAREIGGCMLTSFVDNEKDNPGLGVSLFYASPKLKVTLYIYDLQRGDIPSNGISEVVKDGFLKAKEALREVHKDNLSIGEDEVIDISGVLFYYSKFEYEAILECNDNHARYILDLYFGSFLGKFIKIRTTHLKADEANFEVETFVHELSRILNG